MGELSILYDHNYYQLEKRCFLHVQNSKFWTCYTVAGALTWLIAKILYLDGFDLRQIMYSMSDSLHKQIKLHRRRKMLTKTGLLIQPGKLKIRKTYNI